MNNYFHKQIYLAIYFKTENQHKVKPKAKFLHV